MDGILNLNKPPKISSQQAVTRVKHALRAKKAGHAGTLDPDATGVLVICLGRATRLFDAMQSFEKEYVGTITLGVTTDTYDASGEVTARSAVPAISSEELDEVLDEFRGEIQQVPPTFSALKHKGRPLYEWARRGIPVTKPPRTVTISTLEIAEIAEIAGSTVRLRVVCSKGTYIRSLAHDIGVSIGCGAHLSSLERTRTGPFRIEDALDLSSVDADPLAALKYVLPIETAREVIEGGAPLDSSRYGECEEQP
jgi:tRNA pseudouridine55 synthase